MEFDFDLYNRIGSRPLKRFASEAAREIGARQDFLYLVYGPSIPYGVGRVDIADLDERVRTMQNPLVAYNFTPRVGALNEPSVSDYFASNPEEFLGFLDSIDWAIDFLGIEPSRLSSG